MARKYASLNCIMIVMDFNPSHYINWSQEELLALPDIKKIAHIIKNRLEKKGSIITDMYSCVHEKDIPDDSGFDVITDKKHYHLIIRFKEGTGKTFDELSIIIGIASNFIEKMKPGSNFDNMRAYLIHIKYKNKMQYSPNDVITIAGESYISIYNKNCASWIKAREKVEEAQKNKKKKESIKYKYEQAAKRIKNGELTIHTLYTDPTLRELYFYEHYYKKLETLSINCNELFFCDKTYLLSEIEAGRILSINAILANPKYIGVINRYKSDLESALNNVQNATIKTNESDKSEELKKLSSYVKSLFLRINDGEFTSKSDFIDDENYKKAYDEYKTFFETVFYDFNFDN